MRGIMATSTSVGAYFDRLKPPLLMIIFQTSTATNNILFKIAASKGMKMSVLTAYRSLVAVGFIVPLALVVEWGKRPKLTRLVVFQAFLSGLFVSSLAQNLYAESLVLTSATFASAMVNLCPAITLILSVCFRMEILGFGTRAGKAKILGIIISLSGAMLLTFYKGKELNPPWSPNLHLLNKGGHAEIATQHGSHVLGVLLSLFSCFAFALGFIFQAKMVSNYPCKYSSTALMISWATIQAFVYALCMERSDWSQWKLGWDIRLLSVVFSGVVVSGMMYVVQSWCLQKRGPLYVSVFSPLMLVMVAVAGSICLDEKLHLGTVLGAAVIICGLYIVLWGKGKELENKLESVKSAENLGSNRGSFVGIVPGGVAVMHLEEETTSYEIKEVKIVS